MNDVLDRLGKIRILPVVVIDDAGKAPDLAAALLEGGVGCAEITLRTPDGLRALGAAAAVDGFLVGAGTVLDADQVAACADAGAQFIVSPGFDEAVVGAAVERGLAVLPGVATATEIQRARRAGFNVVKFFPADRLGGLGTIAALSAPFAETRFVPSGGVNAQNAPEYLEHPAIHSVSGSWMASRQLIADADFEAIARLSREASALVPA